MSLRVGLGFDLHRLEEGRPLWLGGVEIPSSKGCIAHSDGDVLIHALCDALLGALALGDIGTHFPHNDPLYKNKESIFFLREVNKLLKENHARIINIDSTIILEKPSLKNFKTLMAEKLTSELGISPHQVSIKAKTHEKVDAIGNEEAIAAHVVVLLEVEP